jgi:hypothetical protein
MFKSFLALIIVFTFSISSVSEVYEVTHSDDHDEYSEQIMTSNASLLMMDDGCSDCQGHDCNEQACCINLLSATSSILVKKFNSQLQTNSYLVNVSNWHFLHKYQSPYLDPALKPPLFS